MPAWLATMAAAALAEFGPGAFGHALEHVGVPGPIGLNFNGRHHRTRRKKALSDSDLKTALTIASAISKKAAENFILMRVRR